MAIYKMYRIDSVENKRSPPYTNPISLPHTAHYAMHQPTTGINVIFFTQSLYSRTFVLLYLHFNKHLHTIQLVLLATRNAYIYFKF